MSVIGTPEAIANLKRVKELVNSEAVQDAILPAAELIRDTASRLVNQGPGIDTKGRRRLHLKELIFGTKGKRSNAFIAQLASTIEGESGPSVIAGVDLKKAPHAHLVEFGHGGPKPAPAHPFMRPAIAQSRARVATIIENAMKRLLAPFSHS